MSTPHGMLFAYIAGTGGGGVLLSPDMPQSVLLPVMSAPNGMLFAGTECDVIQWMIEAVMTSPAPPCGQAPELCSDREMAGG